MSVNDLSSQDLQQLLAATRELAATSRSEDFYRSLARVLQQVLDVHTIGCELFGLSPFRFLAGSPNHDIPDEIYAHFQAVVPDHPYAKAFVAQQGDGFFTEELLKHQGVALKETRIYDEVYRVLNIEHQLGMGIRVDHVRSLNIMLSDEGPISTAQAVRIALLRPHLLEAFRNWEALRQARGGEAWHLDGLEALEAGVMLLDPQGRVERWTARGDALVGEYFSRSRRSRGALPQALGQWVRRELRRMRETPLACPPSYAFEGPAGRLVVRLTPSQRTGRWLLLLRLEPWLPTPELLAERFGLTQARARVLALVARGQSNAQIGEALSISPRTVGKHLEFIYKAMSVKSRSAAAAAAINAVRQPG